MFQTSKARDVLQNRIINALANVESNRDRMMDEVEVEKELLSIPGERRYDPLTEDEVLELFEMGASKEFVLHARYDDGERNSVRENARQALEHDRTTFGDFGNYMWEGDLYRAMQHADRQNARIMQEIFGLEYVNATARRDVDSPVPKRGYRENDDGRVVFK